MNPAFGVGVGGSQGVTQTDSSQNFSCIENEQAEAAWALRDVHGSLSGLSTWVRCPRRSAYQAQIDAPREGLETAEGESTLILARES